MAPIRETPIIITGNNITLVCISDKEINMYPRNLHLLSFNKSVAGMIKRRKPPAYQFIKKTRQHKYERTCNDKNNAGWHYN